MFRSRESKHVRKMKRFINKIFGQAKYRKVAISVAVIVLTSVIMTSASYAAELPEDQKWGVVKGLEKISNAISLEGMAGDLMRGVAFWTLGNLIYGLILVPLGWLLGIAGTFAEWMLQPAYIINSTVVQIGWGVTRDLAHMFFILILLGIALDYILFQSFGVKHALPMLIVVALLINFSLPIAGIFIDFANVFSNFFISKITGDCLNLNVENCCFTMAIAQNLNLTKLYETGGAAN